MSIRPPQGYRETLSPKPSKTTARTTKTHKQTKVPVTVGACLIAVTIPDEKYPTIATEGRKVYFVSQLQEQEVFSQLCANSQEAEG